MALRRQWRKRERVEGMPWSLSVWRKPESASKLKIQGCRRAWNYCFGAIYFEWERSGDSEQKKEIQVPLYTYISGDRILHDICCGILDYWSAS